MQHLSAYLDLGFARMADYAIERLGLRPRRTQTLIGMGRKLDRLPETSRAFEAGRISHSKVCLLLRVATRETEHAWLDKATGMNVRKLEKEVRHARAALGKDGAGAADAGGDAPLADAEPFDEDRAEPMTQVSFPAPAWLRGRWGWAVELFRRTAGASTAVWEAAEAIAADYLSGRPGFAAQADQPPDGPGEAQLPDDPGIVATPLTHDFPDTAPGCEQQDEGIDLFEEAQRALEEEIGASEWSLPVDTLRVILPDGLDTSGCEDAVRGGAGSIDRRLSALIEVRQSLAWHQGRLLRIFDNYRLYRALGFASFSRYCRENLGMSVSRAYQLIALDRRLLELPGLERAYRDGRVSWVVASEIARIADEETEETWIRFAGSVTVRRLREEVALALGDLDDPNADSRARRGLPRGLNPDGRVQMCAPPPRPLPLSSAPGDRATAGDPAPSSGDGNGEGDGNGDVQMCASHEAITTRIRFRAPAAAAQVWRRALATCRAVEGHHLQDWECVARMIESFHRTWDLRGSAAWRRRYRIFERDGWRCRVPGCSSRRNLQAHHVVFRSRGGGEDDGNLVTVCVTHHLRCLHAGTVRCHPLPDGLLAWELGPTVGTAAATGSAAGDSNGRYVEDVQWAAARAAARSLSRERP
jgi:hypothetical protein